jgi:uridine phosphorylase
VCCRRCICGSDCRGAVRGGLPASDQRDFGGSDRAGAGSTVFRCHRALRDEGTSYHYVLPSEYSEVDSQEALAGAGVSVTAGATWTTDAPFRETQQAIEVALQAGILAVEMEAAALYAFARARNRAVLCFAHVTNRMGRIKSDFEKGAADGAEEIAPRDLARRRPVA